MTTQSSKNNGNPAGRGRRIYLQLIRGETTIAQAATAAEVDRSTILRIRTVGKEAAMAALAASKPGVGKSSRDIDLEAAQPEIARLSAACKELAVKLVLVEGKGGPARGERTPSRSGSTRPQRTLCWGWSTTPLGAGWSLLGAVRCC